jgi:O-antigen ligase
MKQEKFSGFTKVIGLTVLAMVLLSALALGANRPVSWSLLSIGVFLGFALQVVVMFANPTPFAARKVVVPGILFAAAILWGAVQSTPGLLEGFAHPIWRLVPDATPAISVDPGQGRHAVMKLLCYAMIFVVMLWTCSTMERASTVLKIIAVASALLAGYGLYSFATGVNVILDDLTRGGIVQASFVNRNSYATFAAFGVLANLAAFLHVSGKQDVMRRRLEAFFTGGWIFALGLLLCLGALSLTQSRAGGMSALFGLAVFLLVWLRDRRGGDWVLLGALLVVMVFIGATSATGLLERMISTDATEGRFTVYPAMFQAIWDRPLLGHGIGAFHETFRPYIPLEGGFGEWVRAHSTYLELAIGLGLPATFALLLSQALITWRIWRGTVVRRNGRIFPCFALGCIATAALHSAFDFSLQMPATAALFAVILALGFAQSFTSNQVKSVMSPNGRPRHNQ